MYTKKFVVELTEVKEPVPAEILQGAIASTSGLCEMGEQAGFLYWDEARLYWDNDEVPNAKYVVAYEVNEYDDSFEEIF